MGKTHNRSYIVQSKTLNSTNYFYNVGPFRGRIRIFAFGDRSDSTRF